MQGEMLQRPGHHEARGSPALEALRLGGGGGRLGPPVLEFRAALVELLEQRLELAACLLILLVILVQPRRVLQRLLLLLCHLALLFRNLLLLPCCLALAAAQVTAQGRQLVVVSITDKQINHCGIRQNNNLMYAQDNLYNKVQ